MYRKIKVKVVMKKFIIGMISLFLLFPTVQAKESVSLYLFYGDGCPHCAHEKEWLEEVEKKYSTVQFVRLETWYNEENGSLYDQVKLSYQVEQNGVPLTIIGDKYFIGFNDYTKEEIKKVLDQCLKEPCEDYVQKIKQGEEIKIEKPVEVKPTTETKIKVEAKKSFSMDTVLLIGIVVVLALLFLVIFGNYKNKQKTID